MKTLSCGSSTSAKCPNLPEGQDEFVRKRVLGINGSSRPGEFHPEALTDPYVNLSIHTAPRSHGSHFSTGEFASNLDAEFAIDIDSENKIPSDELGCLLGNGMRSTCPSPSVVRVRWSLYSDGTVLQGTSDDTAGGSSGPS
jgi:hypothetical protein